MGERRGTKALELWCRRMTEGYKNVNIDNMTTSWRNGLAFCAMIHRFRPDLIDFEKLNQNDIYYNNDLAFRTAEQYLGIPALLDADDMATYEVPDRLSILTYLSQFYQVFSSQDASNRLKRTAPTSVESTETISKTAGTPSKMAHIGSVPKREPCERCSMPVYLAERFLLGTSVYHRTCLKCARCQTQLTLGNFYETEIDGEFCCETCPDEEKSESDQISITNEMSTNSVDNLAISTNSGNLRNSIAERLAFFEMNSGNGKKLLQKSMSDEEKSQSLKKTNVALNNFMAGTLKDENEKIENDDNSETESNDDDDEDDNDSDNNVAPELPTTLPPQNETDNAFDSKSQTDFVNEYSNNETSEANEVPILINTDNDLIVRENLAKDNPNTFNDIEENTVQMRQTNSNIMELNVETKLTEQQRQPRSLSMVHARLQQFEEKTTQSEDTNKKNLSKKKDSRVSSIINEIEKDNASINVEIKDGINDDNNEVPKSTEAENFMTVDCHKTDNNVKLDNSVADANKDADDDVVNIKEAPLQQTSQIQIEITPCTQEENCENETVADEEFHTKLSEDDKEIKTNENEISDTQHEINNKDEISEQSVQSVESIKTTEPITTNTNSILKKQTNKNENYPEELNPFQSDDDDEVAETTLNSTKEKRKSLNPFDSDDDSQNESDAMKKIKPPRPPPPKISKNPFGSESDDDAQDIVDTSNLSSISSNKRMPIPTPRTQLHHNVRDSNNSLTSSTDGKSSRKNRKAPAPPPPTASVSKELFPSTTTISEGGDSSSKKSTPTSSSSTTPKQMRKKRPAPKPPKPVVSNTSTPKKVDETDESANLETNDPSTSLVKDVLQQSDDNGQIEDLTKSQIDKLSDEEKAAHLEGKKFFLDAEISQIEKPIIESNFVEGEVTSEAPQKKLIALDISLLEDANNSNDIKMSEEENSVYRRTIGLIDMTPIKTVTNDSSDMIVPFPQTYDRQSEKLKDNKDAKNRNRQSQLSDDGCDPLLNKSIQGKWKRRKGPAPSLPIPPRRVLQMLPLQEIRHELEIIEVQQQGLEKQGVILETMIRERCEGKNGELNSIPIDCNLLDLPPAQNSKEVEDLILQLFDLVNEKNELFRRQAELMYLRRQHRLEQEQANLEYEIRVSMAQPERNKTDTDKSREEALIARLVEVVQLRNDVIERLEMDRLREAEEDLSIKQRLELHSAKRDEELHKQTSTAKLSKKEKKKLKETKKLEKNKKLDVDKDADESEINTEIQKEKKKKKKFLFR